MTDTSMTFSGTLRYGTPLLTLILPVPDDNIESPAIPPARAKDTAVKTMHNFVSTCLPVFPNTTTTMAIHKITFDASDAKNDIGGKYISTAKSAPSAAPASWTADASSFHLIA